MSANATPAPAGSICPGCKQATTLKDVTCPHCGRILDRYLFSTITAKSLSGAAKEAFQTGYDVCKGKWKTTGSAEIAEYRPVPGHETEYRAGWQCAVSELEGKADRKRGRKRGLKLIAIGLLLTAIGAPWSYFAFNEGFGFRSPYMVLGGGLLCLAMGIVSVITGNSDE
jgi:hypothetical protein